MAWTPDAKAVEELKTILVAALSPDGAQRKAAAEALDHAKLQPEFLNYLAYILVFCRDSPAALRASAGIYLKNEAARAGARLPGPVQEYVKPAVLQGVADPEKIIRNIAGNAVTALFSALGFEQWPQAIEQLMALALGSDAVAQEGALGALAKICEDSAAVLDRPYNGIIPAALMVPKLVEIAAAAPTARAAALSIHALNQFILAKSQSVFVHLDGFLSCLFSLATSPDAEVRKNICTAFVLVLEVRPDKLQPHLTGVVNYCLHSMQDEDESVALEACEFLFGLANSKFPLETLEGYLESIVPVLLDKMVYSEMEILALEMADEDAEKEDEAKDIKPVVAKKKEARRYNSTTRKEAEDAGNTGNADEDDEDEDEEEDDDDVFDAELSQWTLRKCAAATLDLFASVASDTVVRIALPQLKQRLGASDWTTREAAILALGAIAEGCQELAAPDLPQLVPFLAQSMADPQFPVRQIACWTLGRYAQWISGEAASGGPHASYFVPVLHAILACTLDGNKKVQEAGCGAFATLVENCVPELLVPHTELVLRHFAQCFQRYKSKNLPLLFAAVQTFVEQLGPELAAQEPLVPLLLTPLIEKWDQTSNSDKELWPLLECLSSVAAVLGTAFAPYAVPVYRRAFLILVECIRQDQASQTDPAVEMPERDFVVTALDLIDGLVQGLGGHSAELIEANGAEVVAAAAQGQSAASGGGIRDLLNAVLYCLEDPVNEVRQSAWALVGDLSIHVFEPVVLPNWERLVAAVLAESDLRAEYPDAVCNNAVWALGEMALRLGSALRPYLPEIASALLAILQSPRTSEAGFQATVLENAAITIGRIGMSSPEAFTDTVAGFARKWLLRMRFVEENEEKETAFRGFCRIVSQNPSALLTESTPNGAVSLVTLTLFLDCVARYSSPSKELAEMFRALVGGYRDMLKDEWAKVMKVVDSELRQTLVEVYGA